MKKYDYIIAGAGCAGLSLAYYLSQSSLKNKKILLVDKTPKNSNDRTWCFWSQSPLPFENIIHKKWQKLRFEGEGFSHTFDINPYTYCMIRGIDFYNYTQTHLQQFPNFEFLYGDIESITDNASEAYIIVDGEKIQGEWIFNSSKKVDAYSNTNGYHFLKQHFKGWVIETREDFFDDKVAGFMDFRIEQHQETRFFYVLPVSPKQALIEFTIFSENILADEVYTKEIEQYIRQYLKITDFRVLEEEFGVIPMEDIPTPHLSGNRIINIGTLGGYVKPSTGYAFLRIQQKTQKLVTMLEKNNSPIVDLSGAKKYKLYDSALLNIMAHQRYPSRKIFTCLFQKHPMQRIFRFLDEESSFWEDFLIMAKMPALPFIKAILENRMKQKKIRS